MIPERIIEKALYPAAAAISKVIPGDGARAAERAAVEALRAGLAAVYADIQAEALREAAAAAMAESDDLRDSATCHSIALDIRARADELDGEQP